MTPDYLADDELDPDTFRDAPGLSKLNRENPFSVPDGYFDSLADNIQQKINALPDLERMNKENPFHVPEGYFETLPSTIQQRIIDEKNSQPAWGKWASRIFRPKYALALAVVVILLIFGINYLTNPGISDDTDRYLSCDEVKNSSYMNDLDETLLMEVLNEEQSPSSETNEDADLEEYLINNNIDISQLENRL